MKAIYASYRALGKSIAKPELNGESLASILKIQSNALAAKNLDPVKLGE